MYPTWVPFLTQPTFFFSASQVNHKAKLADIHLDSEDRGTIIFAWWMTCLSDAYASAYYRRKPVLDDDDYDIDFYTAGPVCPPSQDNSDGQTPCPSPREQLEVGPRSMHLSDDIADSDPRYSSLYVLPRACPRRRSLR